MRRIAALGLSVSLATVAPMLGCVGAVGVAGMSGCDAPWKTYDATRSVSLSAGEAAASPLRVKTRNGAVKVTRVDAGAGQAGGGPSEIKVIANVRAATPERLEAIVIDVSKEPDGTLFVRPTPPDGQWRSSEGVGFEIFVPGASGVEIDTGNGAISIAGLSGKALLKTSNGSIRIDGHDGDVDADTSNGRIEATGVAGRVVADTSNGRIEVALAEGVEGPVDLDTSNGSITLEVGQAFGGELKASTSNGSVNVDAPGADVSKKRSSATVRFARSGGASVLDTSNGSITVRVRDAGAAGALERAR